MYYQNSYQGTHFTYDVRYTEQCVMFHDMLDIHDIPHINHKTRSKTRQKD